MDYSISRMMGCAETVDPKELETALSLQHA
jgi:hypothetical protein